MRQTKLLAGTALTIASYFASVREAHAQATYTLKPKTVAWGYYDAQAKPVLDVKPELGGLCPAKRAIL